MDEILMTGGTGFIGSHFLSLVKELDFPYRNLSHEEWDFREPWKNYLPGKPRYFIHFGANVNARRSVDYPRLFMDDNVMGTFNVLELARQIKPDLFVYISSAEALGGCPQGAYLNEFAPMRPSNPYGASKAIGELLASTYHRAMSLPAIIVRTQCVWSMDQTSPVRAIPIIKERILNGEVVDIYSRDGIIGSRQWINVNVLCARLLDLLPRAVPGSIYHIVGEDLDNLQMAQLLADKLGKKLLFKMVEISPTHELRYAIKNNA